MSKIFHPDRPPIGPAAALISGFLSFVLMFGSGVIGGMISRELSIMIPCLAMVVLGWYQWPTMPTATLRACFLAGYGWPAATMLNHAVSAAASGVGGGPYVYVALLASLPLLSLLLTWWVCARLLKTPAPNLCSNCGYSLIGNTSGICPECGVSTS